MFLKQNIKKSQFSNKILNLLQYKNTFEKLESRFLMFLLENVNKKSITQAFNRFSFTYFLIKAQMWLKSWKITVKSGQKSSITWLFFAQKNKKSKKNMNIHCSLIHLHL